VDAARCAARWARRFGRVALVVAQPGPAEWDVRIVFGPFVRITIFVLIVSAHDCVALSARSSPRAMAFYK
jgi:hypothetical protein